MIVKVEFNGSKYVAIHEYGIAPENGKNAIHFKKAGLCKLIINGNEGSIAHLHIKGAKIDSAICLNYNKYFPHDGKYEDTLCPDDEEILYKWFLKKSARCPGLTNYQFACKVWNDLNTEGYATRMNDMPYYAHMDGDYDENYKRRRGATNDSL